jgi:DNA-binding SARP family transcriptional activator
MAAPSPSLPRLELHCFGAPTALLGGKPVPREVQGRKHLALLIYLALSPGRRRERAHLVGLLWPEKPESHARHSLNEAMRRLRTHLGAGRLVSEAESIAIDPTALDVDALQFEALVTREPAKAIQLLRGDFLEGFGLDDAPAFEEWARGERAGYRSRAAAALIAFGEDALAATRYAEALEAARQALVYEPFAEPAARLRMRAAALSGDATTSLAAFHEFAGRLAQDLHEQPSRELTALADRIRGQRWRRPTLLHTEEEPALVGQERAHREAFTLVAEALQRGPRTLLITGDPGTGKTRLLTECVERFALEGAVTAGASPLESDRDTPWSTLRMLLRAGLVRAPGSAAADPGALGVLATLAPEAFPSVGPRPPADNAEVAAGLASLLRALTEEQPVALAVDEAHCADGASIEVIGGAMPQLAGLPLLLVLSVRGTFQETPRALVRFKSDIGRVGGVPGQAVHLEPLSEAETRELVFGHSAWCVAEGDRARLARRIFFETSGNPFLIVTMLRGLEQASVLRKDVLAWPRPGETIEGPLPISVPSLARRAVMARVVELDEASLQVLRAASIGARAVDPDLVAVLTGLARERVEDLLAVLERHRLLACDGVRYVFAAPLIAQVVRGECLAAGERRALRARAVAALASRQDLESRLLRVELMARTEQPAVAFGEAMAAAQAALAESAPRAARRALAAAERVLEAGDEQGRRAIDELRARVPA